MYGGSSKVGRGGGAAGRGGPKRNNSYFRPQPPNRASAPSSGRLSLGGSGAPSSRNSNTAALPAVGESFSILSGGKPPAFAMIIRLTPDLVDEIKRVEAQGGNTRIKFGPATVANGNIIDVGGKEFNFTWAHNGDLCDVYEEHQGDEDGEGALVECGCAWRKITVRRFLDESTTNHVKKRSEEADRKMKSRKAIILEHGNAPKGQIKALQAAEATPWRNYSKRKESAMKKRKVEPLPVGGPPKSGYKAGLSSMNATKGRSSSSPLASSPKQRGASSSPFQAVNISKSLDNAVLPNLSTKPSYAASSEKETPSTMNVSSLETLGGKVNTEAKPTDLQSMLISLLMEKPRGMSGKALEKVVGDKIPNSIKKIEPILKKIANYQAPGRYILKPGIDLESIKKPVSGSIFSSPDDHQSRVRISEEIHDETPATMSSFEEKVDNYGLDEQGQVNLETGIVEESSSLEKIENKHVSPNIFIDKKGPEHSGQAGSTSDSGSDSDSESDSSASGSDSDSHSKSISRSPVESGSESSSDSESDASSSSKQASDEDVDIMTSDDEKDGKARVESSEPQEYVLIPVQTADDINEKQNGNVSDAIEIENDLRDNTQEAEIENSYKEPRQLPERTNSSSPEDNLLARQSYRGISFHENEYTAKSNCGYELSDSSERMLKGKHKRDSDMKLCNENSECTKRSKQETSVEISISGGSNQLVKSSRKVSPPSHADDSTIPRSNRGDRVVNYSSVLQKGYGRVSSGKSTLELQGSDGRNEKGSWPKLAYQGENLDHADDKGRGPKHSEKNFQVNEGLSAKKDNVYRYSLTEDDHGHENKSSRNTRDNSNVSKPLGISPKDPGVIGMDKSVNGRGRILQRELSDLELGEIRIPEDTTVKKQFERKNSFKQLEKKSSTQVVKSRDGMKAKPQINVTSESRKPSPAFVDPGFQSNLEGDKNRNSDDCFEDSNRFNSKVGQPLLQQHKLDHHEISKATDTSSKSRNIELGPRQDFDSDGYLESTEKVALHAKKQDHKHGTVPHSLKESKRQTSNSMEMPDGQRHSTLADGSNSHPKRRESSSDENSCSYSKYEKDKPELKLPVRNLPQYEEYVQEYRDKYDSYCSLNKILESYRHDFEKLGKDLENVKGRDTEAYMRILAQMRDSYRRSGTRHKRLKKIFIVLHEELKSLKQRITEFAISWMKE